MHLPRVSDKLAASLIDFVTARELSYAAARAKDSGKRSDIGLPPVRATLSS